MTPDLKRAFEQAERELDVAVEEEADRESRVPRLREAADSLKQQANAVPKREARDEAYARALNVADRYAIATGALSNIARTFKSELSVARSLERELTNDAGIVLGHDGADALFSPIGDGELRELLVTMGFQHVLAVQTAKPERAIDEVAAMRTRRLLSAMRAHLEREED